MYISPEKKRNAAKLITSSSSLPSSPSRSSCSSCKDGRRRKGQLKKKAKKAKDTRVSELDRDGRLTRPPWLLLRSPQGFRRDDERERGGGGEGLPYKPTSFLSQPSDGIRHARLMARVLI
ncbi:unnamed protein product [Musa acuminata subsp. malaccensis]|uniref:(wild Malaysian banana) hypothetical protein n=1 Tax=Musa acuminata subsp. malaccensis TaxID=214687 RepID=A0A804KCX7_MUSAM|nr:unnamed protein product [Musa acuminata subsp. malaccensis]